MHCANCGASIPINIRYCTQCGAEVHIKTRYHYISLKTAFDYKHLEVYCTDQNILNAICNGAQKHASHVEFNQLKDISGHICAYDISSHKQGPTNAIKSWMIRWLCDEGWEPYAVHSNPTSIGNSIYSWETHHFRRIYNA